MIQSTGTSSQVATHVDENVKDFIRQRSLDAEFDIALALARDLFAPAAHVRVTLEHDPEEENAPPDLVFRVATMLARRPFRDARKGFYGALRDSGHERLCDHLAVIRD